MYFCGLKGMPARHPPCSRAFQEKGLVWEDKLKEWKTKGQWHVEVYDCGARVGLSIEATAAARAGAEWVVLIKSVCP